MAMVLAVVRVNQKVAILQVHVSGSFFLIPVVHVGRDDSGTIPSLVKVGGQYSSEVALQELEFPLLVRQKETAGKSMPLLSHANVYLTKIVIQDMEHAIV